uniref:hypothetical protein n=1 Tax=Pseudonocardia pini TaxID=2758030 RepID=UPI001C68FEF3
QVAALLVLRRDGGYGGLDDRHVDLSVYDHRDPIAELVRCHALHRLAYHPSDPANLVGIDPGLARELTALMAAAGFPAPADDGWGPAVQRRFALFLGRENYDNRIHDGRVLDLEVLADLRLRYGTTR